MYRLTVRQHMMIAHSFKGEAFGPAQALHGATYLVDAAFERSRLDENGLIVDIGLATQALAQVLDEFNMRNLDEHPDLRGHNTTTELMAAVVFQRLAAAIKAGRLGDPAQGIRALEITLSESHIAWASFRGEI